MQLLNFLAKTGLAAYCWPMTTWEALLGTPHGSSPNAEHN
jgi:hypothetical protein